MRHGDHHDHYDHSLEETIQTLLSMPGNRRQTLRWLFAAAGSVPLLGCGGGTTAASTASTSSTGTTSSGSTSSDSSGSGSGTGSGTSTGSTGTCAVIPEETGGPYPADGTNSSVSGVANALILSGIVRTDIRSSVAGATGTAQGVPLTIKLHLVNVGASCADLAGAAVYLWHCDRDGNYSMYSAGVTGENYLRGVQAADSSGTVTFTTIFPGCYAGRMPHVHFEVYPSLAKATSAANRIKTSQFTFPLATLNEAYTAAGYSTSVRNLASMGYASDNVFNDGTTLQMAAMSGNATTGYTATLNVGVSA
ncbi:intradiol ring-cleavage dioxygenase [Massilia arenosa]|uniref:Intradiol ring-cleavage dioxygenase n=1 Tax=Zemynaea arenosa TaxID=2561931 RepID=A0A4Y9SF94_9BURK|nr:intradiol ring-cleavage dioxygenase [Massilia arenosa]TFW22245.1 intradiol ring-cleavage dioxygenase [Massilia arenosa]